TPSYIALFGWLIIGLVFFVIRYPKLKQMDNDKLSKLILNRSEDEVVNLINENKVPNQTHK
ncbi:amino acid permease, partial [Mesorhizobium sp. M8A.F.Ca.ET.173.01.1.1]